MSEIFSADAQVNAADITLTASAVTSGPATNPLQPPYQTSKAKVLALLFITPGADATSLTVTIVRNINAEAVTIATSVIAFAAPGGDIQASIGGVDPLPDPRQASYTVQVAQAGGVPANGKIKAGSYIESTLLSG